MNKCATGVHRKVLLFSRFVTSSQLLKPLYFLLAKYRFYSDCLFLVCFIVLYIFAPGRNDMLIYCICLLSLYLLTRFRSIGKESSFSLTSTYAGELRLHFTSIVQKSEISHRRISDNFISLINDAERFHIKKIELMSVHLADARHRRLIQRTLEARIRKSRLNWKVIDFDVSKSFKAKLDQFLFRSTMPDWIAKNHRIEDGNRLIVGGLKIVVVE